MKLIIFYNQKLIVMSKFFYIIIFTFSPLSLYAYIGPGMSGGFLAAVLGFFVAIALAFGGIIYFPIKRAIKNRKKIKDETQYKE